MIRKQAAASIILSAILALTGLTACSQTGSSGSGADSGGEGISMQVDLSGKEEKEDKEEAQDLPAEAGGQVDTESDAQTQETEAQTQEREAGADAQSLDDGSSASSLITAASDLDYTAMFTDRDVNPSWSASGSAQIRLDGDAIETSGEGLSVENNSVVIRAAGTYHVTGTMNDGQIVIETSDDEKVQLVLDGADISCSTSACILIKSADKVFITLAEGSENSLSDTGLTYVQSDDSMNVDAVVFSKSDLCFNGKGSLKISAGYQDGIVSKDDLKFTGGTYEVEAAGKGIVGKDSLRILDGTFTVDSEDDALHTSNTEKAGKGYLYIEGGSFTLSSGDDAVHAATALIIEDGTFDVLKSYEGLEGDTIDIDGGDIRLTATDDGLNAAMSGTAENTDFPQDAAAMNGTDMPAVPEDGFGGPAGQGGTDMPAMPEDGFGGPAGQGGTDMPAMPEDGFGGPAGQGGMDMSAIPEGGFEGPAGTDAAGNGAADDTAQQRFGRGGKGGGRMGGMQAAEAGTGESAMTEKDRWNREGDFGDQRQGAGGGFGMMDVQEDCYIHITDGTIYVSAGGDGIDSNGSIVIDGGTITVDGPTDNGNGALDCGTEAVIHGGTIVAAGSSGMAETFSENSTQYSVLYCFSDTIDAGTQAVLMDSDGNTVCTAEPSKAYSSLVISNPDLGEGTYTIRAGSEEAQIEISSVSTTAGTSSGGMHGGGRW